MDEEIGIYVKDTELSRPVKRQKVDAERMSVLISKHWVRQHADLVHKGSKVVVGNIDPKHVALKQLLVIRVESMHLLPDGELVVIGTRMTQVPKNLF